MTAQAPARIRFVARVRSVEERFERLHVRGTGPSAEFTQRSLGWYVQLDGSYEALYVGDVRPGCAPGDEATVTLDFAKRPNPTGGT